MKIKMKNDEKEFLLDLVYDLSKGLVMAYEARSYNYRRARNLSYDKLDAVVNDYVKRLANAFRQLDEIENKKVE